MSSSLVARPVEESSYLKGSKAKAGTLQHQLPASEVPLPWGCTPALLLCRVCGWESHSSAAGEQQENTAPLPQPVAMAAELHPWRRQMGIQLLSACSSGPREAVCARGERGGRNAHKVLSS